MSVPPPNYDPKLAQATFAAAMASGASTIFAHKAWPAYEAARQTARKGLTWTPDADGGLFASLLIRALTEGRRLLISDLDQLSKLRLPDRSPAINVLLVAIQYQRIMFGGKSIVARLGFAVDAIWQGPGEVDPAILRRFEIRFGL